MKTHTGAPAPSEDYLTARDDVLAAVKLLKGTRTRTLEAGGVRLLIKQRTPLRLFLLIIQRSAGQGPWDIFDFQRDGWVTRPSTAGPVPAAGELTAGHMPWVGRGELTELAGQLRAAITASEEPAT